MTAQELADLLIKGPNLPVLINGWGSDEGLGPFEVSGVFTFETLEGKAICLDCEGEKFNEDKA